jgi:hypothetical protein
MHLNISCARRSKPLTPGLYNDIAQKITSGSHSGPADVIAALNPVYPEDNQFKAAFAEKELRTTNSRNKKVVRYILFEIERQQSGQEFDFESATYNTVFQYSRFHITRAVAEHYDTWNAQKIEARQKQLASVAAGIWKIDFGG